MSMSPPARGQTAGRDVRDEASPVSRAEPQCRLARVTAAHQFVNRVQAVEFGGSSHQVLKVMRSRDGDEADASLRIFLRHVRHENRITRSWRRDARVPALSQHHAHQTLERRRWAQCTRH